MSSKQYNVLHYYITYNQFKTQHNIQLLRMFNSYFNCSKWENGYLET